MPEAPMCIPRSGEAAASMSATAQASQSTGRRMTARTIEPKTRLCAAGRAAAEAINGTRSAFTRSPRSRNTAGSSVRAAATETMPTRIAPVARLRMTVLSTSSRPTIASTKALPLKSTARLAVEPATRIASSRSRPAARSSRNRETTKSA